MINLKIPPKKAISLINERIDDIKTVRANPNGPDYYDVVRWCSKTWSVIDEIYEAGDYHPEEIRMIGLSNCTCNSAVQALLLAEAYHSRLQDYINEIQDSVETSEK
jgi:hypothetical protein